MPRIQGADVLIEYLARRRVVQRLLKEVVVANLIHNGETGPWMDGERLKFANVTSIESDLLSLGKRNGRTDERKNRKPSSG